MADTKTKSATPAVPDTATGELVPLSKEMVVAWLAADDLKDQEPVEEVDLDEAIRILGADTLEEALKPTDVRKFETLPGKTFTVLSVRWRRSTKYNPDGARLAILSCVDSDGVPFITSTASTKPVLKLRKAQLGNYLPTSFAMVSDDTSSGNTVFDLVIPDKDF